MKITEIRGYHVGFPLAEPVGNAVTFFHQREFLLVEVITDKGITGWGEVGAAPHPAAASFEPGLPLCFSANRLWTRTGTGRQ